MAHYNVKQFCTEKTKLAIFLARQLNFNVTLTTAGNIEMMHA